MTLLCRDEADVLADWIRYHLSKGVDHIVVTDNGSKDGSVELLSEFAQSGYVTVFEEASYTHDQATWVSRMADFAFRNISPDWLIHSDADEFWWCDEPLLHDVLIRCPDTVRALRVARSNFLPPVDGNHAAEEAFWGRQLRRQVMSVNSLGQPLPPKVCHRAAENIWVSDGNHSVQLAGRTLATAESHDLQILHFPIRSYEQFERKIRQGTEALYRNYRIAPGVGRTWRFLYENYLVKGRLRAYYEEFCSASSTDYAVDTRLRDYFAAISPQVSPGTT